MFLTISSSDMTSEYTYLALNFCFRHEFPCSEIFSIVLLTTHWRKWKWGLAFYLRSALFLPPLWLSAQTCPLFHSDRGQHLPPQWLQCCGFLLSHLPEAFPAGSSSRLPWKPSLKTQPSANHLSRTLCWNRCQTCSFSIHQLLTWMIWFDLDIYILFPQLHQLVYFIKS